MSPGPEPLLTTSEIAAVLQIHPKHVYRLLRRGLPGRRLGGEWRFVRGEVLSWVEGGTSPKPSDPSPIESTQSPIAPSLLAANGDLVIEELLSAVNATTPLIGFILADRERGLDMLRAAAVVAAGSHGKGPPARLGDVRLARIHLVKREVGLVSPSNQKPPKLADLSHLRFATRPNSAGVLTHFEQAAAAAHLDLAKLNKRSHPYNSHREVVCAVLRGEADVGLATRAWAHRVNLRFRALAEESYGLLVRAVDLGDPRVVRICEVAQSAHFRRALSTTPGYDLTNAGDIRYDQDPKPPVEKLPPSRKPQKTTNKSQPSP